MSIPRSLLLLSLFLTIAFAMDPKCKRGILNSQSTVCCAAKCGECIQRGCATRGTETDCCPAKINTGRIQCTESDAPCVLPSPSSPTVSPMLPNSGPDPKCKRGKYNARMDTCCPSKCKSCAFDLCKAGSKSPCCVRDIQKAGGSCNSTGPPCVVARKATSPVPTPATVIPDPKCERGKLSFIGDVCCPKTCSTCSYTACKESLDCCPRAIRTSNFMCKVRGPPCAMTMAAPKKSSSPKPSPSKRPTSPDPLCTRGILNFKRTACCPKYCSTCNFSICNSKPGPCCVTTIIKAGNSCASRGPPCVPVLPSPSKSPSASPSSSMVPPSVPPPDPRCTSGKLNFNRNACCPPSCEKCGSSSCKATSLECCPFLIRSDGMSCAERGPPCVPVLPSISSTPMPSASKSSTPSSSSVPSRSSTPRPSTPRPSTTSSPSPPAVSTTPPTPPDPMCKTGKMNFNKNACCPASCRFCGPASCPESGGKCCPNQIKNSGISCAEQGPPCIPVTPSPTPSVQLSPSNSESPIPPSPSSMPFPMISAGPPDPDCKRGKLNFNRNACCPASCRFCGPASCPESDGECCPLVIRRVGISCASQGPPCVPVSPSTSAIPATASVSSSASQDLA